MRGASRVGRPNAGGAYRLARRDPPNRSTSSRLLGSGRITVGHPFSGEDCPADDGFGSVVACARATIGDATKGGTARHHGCRGVP
jgi:hypothetical protein